MASREVSHRSDVERFLLSNVDAQGVLEILLAPPAELHDDRVLWRGHGESESTPGDVPPGPEGLLISRRRGRHEVDPIGRSLVLDRHMPASVSASWRSWAETKNPDFWKPATIFGICFTSIAAMTSTSVVVRGMPNANTVTPPTKTCSTRLARRTPSAVLRTSSRLRLFGGIAQAPRGFDEFESHFQRLAWSETSRPEGRVREGSESFLVSVPSLPESVHISGSPHGVLDDSSLKYETILERNRS